MANRKQWVESSHSSCFAETRILRRYTHNQARRLETSHGFDAHGQLPCMCAGLGHDGGYSAATRQLQNYLAVDGVVGDALVITS
jgi:hypothetical protein